MKPIALGLLLFLLATASRAVEVALKPEEQLIDELAQIDAPAPGLHGTASALGFIAEDKPMSFGGGILGSAAPKISPAMRELSRRGVAALPALIAHLEDQRPTKLIIGGGFFMFRYFGDEYEPRVLPEKRVWNFRPDQEKMFSKDYTVKIGDACYAIIGQIVNRNLAAVRYQPTGGLVVNSPVETPALAEHVRQDWATLDADGHRDSLLADAQSPDRLWPVTPALVRLRFYYPAAYESLRTGAGKMRVAEFEAQEKRELENAAKAKRPKR